MNLIPFSSFLFFPIIAGILIVAYLWKWILRKYVAYDVFIFILSFFYLIVFIRKYFLPAILFVSFEYAILGLYFTRLKKRLPCFLLMLLPLLLAKTNHYPMNLAFIGLSFASFRSVQLLFSPKLPDLIRFTDFLLFFPIILSGPIDRYKRFEKELDAGYQNMNGENLVSGWRYLLLGFLQKFIIAESVLRLWLSKLDPESVAVWSLIQNAVSYSVYLYFDFAGYSLMAIGISAMLGLHVPRNFHHPYLAKNPVEFWQRWHITLGEWLRDFVFMPVYKWLLKRPFFSDLPLSRQNLALYLTFQIMGAWHGLQFHYLLEGALFGLYSIAHNSYLYFLRKYSLEPFRWAPLWLRKSFSRVLMIIFACLGLYVFSGRAPFFH